MQSLINATDLEPDGMQRLFARADAMRGLRKTPAGRVELANVARHRRALNVFAQPSSRTYLSFEAAEAILGMDRMNVRDLTTSSAAKGESLEDTLRTFLTYCDLFVLRHPDDGAAAIARQIGEERGVPVINAGSGTREHPTQALLDLYTIQRERGTIAHQTYLLAGDLKRGRTVRSLAALLAHYPGVEILLAAPSHLQMDHDVLDQLDAAGVPWRTLDQLDVQDADVVYLTRVQDEWDAPHNGHTSTQARFRFTRRHLDALKVDAVVMHPLPKRDEISAEVCASRDPRLAWWRQVENGLWTRAAVIEHLLR